MSLLEINDSGIRASIEAPAITSGELVEVGGLYTEPKTLGEGLFSDKELGIKKIGLHKDRKEELVETIVSAIINSDAYNDRIEQRGDADTGILLVTYDEELLTELKDIMHSYKDVIISTDELSKAVVEAIAEDKTDLAVEPNVKVDTDESRSVFVDPRLLSLKDAASGKLALAYSVVETKPVETRSIFEIDDKVSTLEYEVKKLKSEILQLMSETHGNSETETETVTNPESVTETETSTLAKEEPDTETNTLTETDTVTGTASPQEGGVVPTGDASAESTSSATVEDSPASEATESTSSAE